MRKLPFLLLSLLFLFQTPSFAWAQEACATVFSTPLAFGEFKPWFLGLHSTKYSFETSLQSDIKNQGAIGICHLYSITSQFEHRYQQRTRAPLTLSAPYLLYNWWMVQAVQTLGGGKVVREVSMGGQFSPDWKLIQLAGLMPEAAWQPRNAKFNASKDYSRVDEYIRNILNRAILKAKNQPPEQHLALFMKTVKEIQTIVDGYLGVPPAQFVYEGKSYTPKTFAAEFFPELQQPYHQYFISGLRRGRSEPVKGNDPLARNEAVAMDTAEALVKKALDEGQNVYLGYEHNGDFVDNATGIMSISGFHFPRGGGPIPRAVRFAEDVMDGGHAVQIVGYDLDPATGQIIKFKIKNSWGDKVGTDGFYHMYRDYFRAFALSFATF